MTTALDKTQNAPPPAPTVAPPSFSTLDHVARAMMARATQGVSPHAQAAAWFDWASHLSRAPGRQLELGWLASIYAARLWGLAMRDGVENLPFAPEASDRRFADPAWHKWPYVFWEQAFLAQEDWWRNATHQVRGERTRTAARVAFMARQLLDGLSPSNVPWLNPVIVRETLKQHGDNLARGAHNLSEDVYRFARPGSAAAAGRLPRRRGHRGDARRSRVPQRSHRAHPVQAGDGGRLSPSRC